MTRNFPQHPGSRRPQRGSGLKQAVEQRIVAARPDLAGRLCWDDINYLVDHTSMEADEIVARYLDAHQEA